MEFKGVKSRWISKCLFNNWLIIDEETDCVVQINNNESHAKLIASAPQLLEALQEIQIDLSILKSNFIQIEKTDSRAKGMTDIIDKWIERNKKAIEKALL